MSGKVKIIIGVVALIVVALAIGVLVYIKNSNSNSYDLSGDNQRDIVVVNETAGTGSVVDTNANIDLPTLLQGYVSGLSDLNLTGVKVTNADGTPYEIALNLESTKTSNNISNNSNSALNSKTDIASNGNSANNNVINNGSNGNSNQESGSNSHQQNTNTPSGVVNIALDFDLNTSSDDKEGMRHELENAANGLAVDIASATPIVQKAVINFNVNGGGVATLIYERDGSNMFLQEITLPDSLN